MRKPFLIATVLLVSIAAPQQPAKANWLDILGGAARGFNEGMEANRQREYQRDLAKRSIAEGRTLEGFQNTPWGANPSDAINLLSVHNRYYGLTESGFPYFGGNLAGYDRVKIIIGFSNDQLSQATAVFRVEDSSSLMAVFYDLYSKLLGVYGAESEKYYYSPSQELNDFSDSEIDSWVSKDYEKRVIGASGQLAYRWRFREGASVVLWTGGEDYASTDAVTIRYSAPSRIQSGL